MKGTGANLLSNFACHHPPSNLAFPQLLLFSIDRLRAETDASGIVLPWYEYAPSGSEQVVCEEVVLPSQDILRHTVPQRERRDRINIRIHKVKNILSRLALLRLSWHGTRVLLRRVVRRWRIPDQGCSWLGYCRRRRGGRG